MQDTETNSARINYYQAVSPPPFVVLFVLLVLLSSCPRFLSASVFDIRKTGILLLHRHQHQLNLLSFEPQTAPAKRPTRTDRHKHQISVLCAQCATKADFSVPRVSLFVYLGRGVCLPAPRKRPSKAPRPGRPPAQPSLPPRKFLLTGVRAAPPDAQPAVNYPVSLWVRMGILLCVQERTLAHIKSGAVLPTHTLLRDSDLQFLFPFSFFFPFFSFLFFVLVY